VSGTTHWEGCDPERYNVDGPVERLLGDKGVSRIILVDWMMGGPRYSKNYDVVEMLKLREIYRHLSNAADRGDQAANVLGDIVVKKM